jgi:cytochrome c oxidase cbb3-type subunit 3
MLYPGAGRTPGTPPLKPPTVTVRPKVGPVVTGTLTFRDEFTIALTDSAGWHRSWPTSQVTFTIDNPLQAHVDQLGTYTDKDMHDVLAYLQTLR